MVKNIKTTSCLNFTLLSRSSSGFQFDIQITKKVMFFVTNYISSKFPPSCWLFRYVSNSRIVAALATSERLDERVIRQSVDKAASRSLAPSSAFEAIESMHKKNFWNDWNPSEPHDDQSNAASHKKEMKIIGNRLLSNACTNKWSLLEQFDRKCSTSSFSQVSSTSAQIRFKASSVRRMSVRVP